MCGIAGFVGETAHPGTVLKGMLARIRHRGPDGSGMFFDARGGAALGHCRLAILDLDGGAQPMLSLDRTLAVVYNGEIYNYRELTKELTAAGHCFRTHSDTEVLLHGYEQWGDELPEHLRGMFAFVIWDKTAGELFAARDFFGVKPLYYYQKGGTLLFGSEIKCFLEHPAFEKRLNTAQLSPYLTCQYAPGPSTFFEGVYQLPPGHRMHYRDGQLTLACWGEPHFVPQAGFSLPQWQRAIDTALRGSVDAHCLADVEVGCFLSGGVDSSLLASLAGPRTPQTFTVGYAAGDFDETEQAGALAALCGQQNSTALITPQAFWNTLPDILYHMDEPLGDASAAALYFLNREAAKKVKVCLSGEGADELFGGYNIYCEPFCARWYDALPSGLRRGLGAVATHLPAGRGVNFLERRALDLPQRYLGPTNLMSEARKNALLRPAYRSELPTVRLAAPYFAETEKLDPVTRMQRCDLSLWLPGDILLKADKMSMAHSVEVRVPFLDAEVFEVARRLPAGCKADATHTKMALRAAAAGVLPPARAAAKKRGFPVPVRGWLRTPSFSTAVEMLFESEPAKMFFEPEALHTLLERHLCGQADNWRQIWCVTCFLVWFDRFFGEGA